jgi:hypothetical protein
MEPSPQDERELRAARNQALFRAINEKLKTLNEAFAEVTNTFTIACECADTACLAMIEIDPHEYAAMRAEPRRFAVLPGHVYPDVEFVVHESDGYVVVEKTLAAAEAAEMLARATGEDRR